MRKNRIPLCTRGEPDMFEVFSARRTVRIYKKRRFAELKQKEFLR